MVTLAELSTDELQYMRSKWSSEKTELEKERSRKLERLNERLDNQLEDADAQNELQADLAHAQAVLASLQGSGAAPALISDQQAVVAELQGQVDSFGLNTSYVSKTDARIIQMELAELEFAANQRGAEIAEIDTLLG